MQEYNEKPREDLWKISISKKARSDLRQLVKSRHYGAKYKRHYNTRVTLSRRELRF